MDAATPHRDPLRYTIPPSASSLLPPLASPVPSSCIPSHQVSPAPPQIPLSPVDNGIAPMEQGGLEQEQDCKKSLSRCLGQGLPHPPRKRRRSPARHVERRSGPTMHVLSGKLPARPICISGTLARSETVGGKRSLSHGSESSRARKDAKIINVKVEMTQLKNSKTPRRKMSPTVSRSPIMNMIARNKAQSHAGTSKSPKLHARSPNLHPRSPNQAGTSRSPNLHDLSPTLAHGTQLLRMSYHLLLLMAPNANHGS